MLRACCRSGVMVLRMRMEPAVLAPTRSDGRPATGNTTNPGTQWSEAAKSFGTRCAEIISARVQMQADPAGRTWGR